MADVNIRIQTLLDRRGLDETERGFKKLEAGARSSGSEVGNMAAQMSSLGQGLRGAEFHAHQMTAGMSQFGRATAASTTQVSQFSAGLKGVFALAGTAAIANFAKEVGQVAIQLQKTKSTLEFSTGSTVEAGKAYEFARAESQRLGLEVQSTALQFAKLTAASRGTTLSLDGVKQIFSSIGEAATVFGLSTSEVQGIYLALTQVMSKGVVMAEEWRLQLAERLPVANSVAAKALGVTTAEFTRMLTAGELVASDFLPRFAQALHDEVGVTATKAAQGLQAQLNRLSNSWNDFLLAVGNTGAISAATSVINTMAESIQIWAGVLKDAISLWDKWQQNDIGRLFAAQQRPQPRRDLANLVPGGASAVPRSGSNDSDVFRDAELRREQNALAARQKAEEQAHKESLKRIKDLGKEQERVAKDQERAARAAAKAEEDLEKERLKSIRERALAQNALARAQNQGLKHTLDLIKEESRAWDKLDDERLDAIKEQEKAAEEAAQKVQEVWQNLSQDISHALTDAIFRGFEDGKGFAQNFADSMLNMFKTLATRMLQGVLTDAVGSLFQAGISMLSGGGAIAGGTNLIGGSALLGGGGTGGGGGLGGVFDLLGTGSSISSLFGGPSLLGGITGSINSFGSSTLGLGTSGISSLSGLLGAGGAGVGIGSLISGLMGGNTTVGSIAGGLGGIGGGFAASALAGAGGAAAGAAAGSVVPVIGTVIGAILGGLLGGAIKATPPRGHTSQNLAKGTISEAGKKGFDPKEFDPLVETINKSILTFDKELGIGLIKERVKFWIGFNAEQGFRTTVRGKDVNFQDPDKLVAAILKEKLSGPVSALDDPIARRIGQNALAEEGAEDILKELGKGLQLRTDIKAFKKIAGPETPAINELREAMKGFNDLVREYKRLFKEAPTIGEDRKEITTAFKARKKGFREELAAEFLNTGPDSPEEQAEDISKQLTALGKVFKVLRKSMKKAGASAAELAELDAAFAERQEDLFEARQNLGKELERSKLGAQAQAFSLAGAQVPLHIQQAQLVQQFQELREQFEELGLSTEHLSGLQQTAMQRLLEERERMGLSAQARAFELAGRSPPLAIQQALLANEFKELTRLFEELGLSTNGLGQLQAEAMQRLRDERARMALNARARAFELAGEEVPLTIQIALITAEFAALRKQFIELGLNTSGLTDLQAKAIAKLKKADSGFIGFLLDGGVIVKERPSEFFAATGMSNRLFTSPSKINVAESGPELVTVVPPGMPQRSGSSNVVIQMNGPAIFSDLTMDTFARNLQRTMASRSLRFG